MAQTELYKKRRWEIILIVFSCVLTAALSLIIIFLSPKNESNGQANHQVINYISDEISSKDQQSKREKSTKTISGHLPNRINKQDYKTIETTRNSQQYVEVYLNINSNDKVLVNGKPATAEEISETPNTLKLIGGNRYTIQINNCPEKEIIASENLTISVCM